MRTLSFLLQKEFKQIFRDPAILRLIFIMPIIQLLLLPWAADYEIKNIDVAIVDLDRSVYSQRLIDKIQYSSYFKLQVFELSYKDAMAYIEDETVDLILEIPKDFERDLTREDASTVFIAVNAINGTMGNLGAAYAGQIIRRLNQNIRMEWFQMPRFSPIKQISVTERHWFNPTMNYQVFMVPGILAILLTMVGGFLTSLNIVKEKEIGTIEQINVTPIKKHHFILGKLIPFWVLGLFMLTIGLIISFIAYGIIPAGSILMLYGFSALYLLAVMGLGLFISTITETQQQALLVSFFFMLIAILLSGLYTPIDSMPRWAQWIAMGNPVTYMVEVMRMLVLKGSASYHVYFHMGVVFIFALILNSLAVWNYRKSS
jgi:ABC-2 type transport system permease protein